MGSYPQRSNFSYCLSILWLRSSSVPKRRTSHDTLIIFQCWFWFYGYRFIQYYQVMTPISHGAHSFSSCIILSCLLYIQWIFVYNPGCLSAWITYLFKTVVEYFKAQRKFWKSADPNSVVWGSVGKSWFPAETSERWWGKLWQFRTMLEKLL